MGRLEELQRTLGANAGESMGAGRAPVSLPRETPPAAGPPARFQGLKATKAAAEISLDKIERDPGQPREEFEPEALERLAESMKARGQLQPIRVRWDEGRGAYLIVCGERRWRAARMAGLATLTAIVTEDLAPAELLAVQLVENALREDLRPVEQAKAYRTLIDLKGWSLRQLARELAVSHSGVVKVLSLLDLPPEVQAEVEKGALPAGTAYELSKLETPEARTEMAAAAVAGKLSRSVVAEAVREKRAPNARRRVEFKAPGGAVVTVSLPEGADVEAALRFALKAARKPTAA